MNKFEEKIKKLAETYGKNPDEFINVLENSSGVLQEKKGDLFLEIGGILYNLSFFKLILTVLDRALKYFIDSKDKPGELSCYGNLGIAHYHLGDFRKAIEYYERALEINKEVGNKILESRSYGNLGNAYDSLGNSNKAIEYHKRALGIDREIGDRSGEASCYANLGVDHFNLGDFRKAIEYQKKALGIDREIGDRSGEASCYAKLSIAYYSLGEDFNEATKYQKRALEIAKEIGDSKVEASCYGNLSIAYRILGDLRKAFEYNDRALEIKKEIGDRSGELKCYANLGITYSSLGDFKKAVEYYKKALKIAKEIGDLDSERIGTYHLALIYGDNINKPELAYDYCRKSLELSEKITGRLIEEEHKIGFSSRISNAYQYMVPLCLKLKKGNESFEFMERGKSRVFLDLLAATEIKPSVKVTPKLRSLLDEEEDYLIKLREIQTRHLRQKKITIELGEIDKILEKLGVVYKEIEVFDPEYVFIRRGKPLSFTEIQGVLTSQKKDTVLVEYFTIKDKVFIFIVSSKDKKLQVETVLISQERLTLYIENYWSSVVRYPDYGDIGNSWLGLSDYLIDPISKYL